MRASRRARAAAVAALVALLPAAPAGARLDEARTPFENRVSGHALDLPPGWQARVAEDGSTILSTYPVRPRAAFGAAVPARGASVVLIDYGRLPHARNVAPEGRRLTLPRESRLEGFGLGSTVVFARGDHVFQAFVKLGAAAGARTKAQAVRVLDGVRLTPRAAEVANIHSSVLLGRSHDGRPIRARRVGNPRSTRKILVVGCIHGTECAGTKVTRMLAELTRPLAADVWIVHDLNPDGHARGARQNGRGVDLNRNFDSEWRRHGRRWDPEYSGPRPFSEREARIARNLVARLRPRLTLWYHQPEDVVRAWGPSIPAARRFAALAGERFRAIRWPAGSAPNWQNHRFPGAAAFVVELPPGELADARARRHVRAILALAE